MSRLQCRDLVKVELLALISICLPPTRSKPGSTPSYVARHFFHSLVPPSTTPLPQRLCSVLYACFITPLAYRHLSSVVQFPYHFLARSSWPLPRLAILPSLFPWSTQCLLTLMRVVAPTLAREDSHVEIWDGLEQCWEDFESLRRGAGCIGTVGGLPLRSAYQDWRQTPLMTRS
ncbi:uncharacterized protein EDB91DRAFT_47256 [Suillus paluster]|uniref:uncharacterized protein n=1 Tax=Suillus paluster TaxID=48578 RepID=UPI001B86F07A|nr:uncharacterized protein EDB91DRAFT_47256 [Suillus paluster]KAG1747851.1 hypothetical protein EDB91DRAFT_47256 [Suillus paluster]